jgi:monothiol glutaredoxin
MSSPTQSLQEEILNEIKSNKIVVFSKGTKDNPRCGFTVETVQFFDRYNVPCHFVDVLENMPKREALTQMTNWPTLPKVFIGGEFYGDTDILEEMASKGELEPLLKGLFEENQA